MPIDDIISDIESSVSRLVTQPVFIEWLGKNAVEGGDYVVINDSFVYRATSTVKSQKHLVLRADQNGILEPQQLITEGLRFNLDFKHFGKRAPKPPVSTLEEAASEEVVSLGELLFILIGEIHDTTVLEETIGHADFDTMYWDPNATDSVEIANRLITVRDVHDEAHWLKRSLNYTRVGVLSCQMGFSPPSVLLWTSFKIALLHHLSCPRRTPN